MSFYSIHQAMLIFGRFAGVFTLFEGNNYSSDWCKSRRKWEVFNRKIQARFLKYTNNCTCTVEERSLFGEKNTSRFVMTEKFRTKSFPHDENKGFLSDRY